MALNRALPRCRTAGSRIRQAGFTLVELMVGLTLGLIVTTALLLLFANASANGRDIARVGMQIENGRYVAELLREDLRLAGFFGETSVAGALYLLPDPCSTVPTGWGGAPLTFPAPVEGYAAADVLGCLDHRKAGTDALAVRRLSVETIDPATLAGGNTDYYVQYSYCVSDIASPRLVFGTDRNAFTLHDRACAVHNNVRRYISRVYYIADCNRCGIGGDSIPTLKRLDLTGNTLTTTALAEGVESLRFEYGFDVDGHGTPDAYRPGLAASGPSADWSNVVAVKAHFITRSLEKASAGALATAQHFNLGDTASIDTPADGYSRRAYSNAIRIVNPSAVRETQ